MTLADNSTALLAAKSKSDLNSSYPNFCCALHHSLAANELFEIDALAELAEFLGPDNVEYNRGNIGIETDPDKIPENGLSIAQTIRTIRECESWAVLKQVQRHPEYAKLINDCLDEVRPVIEAHTGQVQQCEAFIFISSPNAVTPYHMDPEHNILFQIAGRKFMNLFPRNDERFCTQTALEEFHAGGHRNLKFDNAMLEDAAVFDLCAGDAVYVPVTAPHWVQNGEDVSLSLSVTWRSKQSKSESHLHQLNRKMRKLGLKPPMPGQRKWRDGLISGVYSTLKRLKPN